MKKLKQELKDNILAPCYLVVGPEDYLRKSCREALRRKVCGDDTMNFTYREGRGFEIAELREIAQTLPFLAPRRLIMLENTGLLKKGGEELAELLTELPPETILVMVEEESDKRSKLYKAFAKLGRVVECGFLSEEEYRAAAQSMFRQGGYTIDRDALDLLLERCGGEMNTLSGESEKLMAYCLDKKAVSLEDVERITSVTLQGRIFSMIDAMALGRPREAYLLYEELRALREPPLRILYLITQQVERILAVKELGERGLSTAAIAETLGVKPYAVGKYAHQARAFSREGWQMRLEHCLNYDHAVKRGDLSDQMAAELALVEMSSR